MTFEQMALAAECRFLMTPLPRVAVPAIVVIVPLVAAAWLPPEFPHLLRQVFIGLASVALAALLSYPFAFVFERGGNSIVGPAILHTGANAPVLIFGLPEDMTTGVLLAHMGVVLISLYLVFASRLRK